MRTFFFFNNNLFIGFKLLCFTQNKKFKFLIVFKNKVYCFILPLNFILIFKGSSFLTFSITLNYFFSTWFFLISNFFSGLLKNWKSGFQLVGVGFRYLKITQQAIVFKLGLSHLIKVYLIKPFILFQSSKRLTKILFFSNSKVNLTKIMSVLRLIRCPDNYNGKGFTVFSEIVKLKKREKFGVF